MELIKDGSPIIYKIDYLIPLERSRNFCSFCLPNLTENGQFEFDLEFESELLMKIYQPIDYTVFNHLYIREISACTYLNKLNCPNIITLLYFGTLTEPGDKCKDEQGYRDYTIYEFVKPAKTFSFGFDIFINYYVQLLKALCCLQRASIAHLNIRPESIMISPKTGQLKLSDFSYSFYLNGHNDYLKVIQRDSNSNYYSLDMIRAILKDSNIAKEERSLIPFKADLRSATISLLEIFNINSEQLHREFDPSISEMIEQALECDIMKRPTANDLLVKNIGKIQMNPLSQLSQLNPPANGSNESNGIKSDIYLTLAKAQSIFTAYKSSDINIKGLHRDLYHKLKCNRSTAILAELYYLNFKSQRSLSHSVQSQSNGGNPDIKLLVAIVFASIINEGLSKIDDRYFCNSMGVSGVDFYNFKKIQSEMLINSRGWLFLI